MAYKYIYSVTAMAVNKKTGTLDTMTLNMRTETDNPGVVHFKAIELAYQHMPDRTHYDQEVQVHQVDIEWIKEAAKD